MRFRLDYNSPRAAFNIDHASKLLLAGSCFTENIGAYLKELHYNVNINPFGTLFNPLSIASNLGAAIHRRVEPEMVFERDGKYYSYLYPGQFSNKDRGIFLEQLQEVNTKTHDYIKKTDVVLFTFGTAYAYVLKEKNVCVANCHKMPSNPFEKKLITVEEIVTAYTELIIALRMVNPNIKIVFTVSPVKHIKDGLIENNLSKSVLILAAHQLCKLYHAVYFPAYELVNDDLRDYRFYKADLAHPNAQAVEYVWQKFSECFFNFETLKLNEEITALNKALQHRPMSENTEEIKKHEEFIDSKKEQLKKRLPDIRF